MKLKGIAASEGIAIAKVLKLVDEPFDLTKRLILNVEDEVSYYHDIIKQTTDQLKTLALHVEKKISADAAKIFEAQLLMANDPEVIREVEELIRNESVNLAYALTHVLHKYEKLFESIHDAYLKERVLDLKDVFNRMLKNVYQLPIQDLAAIDEPVILIAYDITPSQASQLDKHVILGFATISGGKTSHSAIIAKMLDVPAVVGIPDLYENLENGETIVIDGFKGELITKLSEKTISQYQATIAALEKEKNELKNLIGKPTQTKDGQSVHLYANIGSSFDLEDTKTFDAEGVGLFRTEFLYLNRNTAPAEEEQFLEYKKVLETMYPKPVIIRTLDIGGDKVLPYLDLAKEENPFLGMRAIRLSFNQIELFRTQLRAILRASAYGNLKIMFPMISLLDEFLQAKSLVEEIKKDLDLHQIDYKKELPLGIMIETPASAFGVEHLAKHVDFLSIGTNDLIQYTMAADRLSQSLSYLYQPFNPIILGLIQKIATAAKQAGIEVSLCGEMASDLDAAPLLIGLGITHLSLIPNRILKLRSLISTLSLDELKNHANQIVQFNHQDDVINLINKFKK